MSSTQESLQRRTTGFEAVDGKQLASVLQRVVEDPEFITRLRADPSCTLREVGLEVEDPERLALLKEYLHPLDELLLKDGDGKKVFAVVASGLLIVASAATTHFGTIDDNESGGNKPETRRMGAETRSLMRTASRGIRSTD